MRRIRVIAVILILSALLTLQGCSKTWYVDFTKVSDVDDWKKQDWSTPPHVVSVSASGLYVDSVLLTAPFGFDGDFTMTVQFSLNVSASDFVLGLQLMLTGGGDAVYSEYISSDFYSLGLPPSDQYPEGYSIYEGSPGRTLAEGDEIPGLNRAGLNTYRFIKKGNSIKMFMNDDMLCDDICSSYSEAWFFPVIYVVYGLGTGELYIKNIKVVYSGDITTLP